MKVALISLDQKWEDKAHNLGRCEDLVSRAAGQGAQLVIFPEMTLTGFTMNTELSAEDAACPPSVAAFGAIAAKHGVALIAGLVVRSGTKAANTLVALSPSGEPMARYVKMHPFSFAGEDRFFEGGKSLSTMTLGDWTIGLSICYDLRFPELYSALARVCDVLVNIANWPLRRVEHWTTMLRARAIENQAYVIGVNRIGVDGNAIEYGYSSCVVDANGDLEPPLFVEGELSIHHISKKQLLEFRSAFPTRQDRCPDLYRTLI